MTITAINAQSSNMMLMTEWHRLWPPHPGIGHIRRALHLGHCPKHRGDYEYSSKNGGAGDCVRAAMKNLCHRSTFSGNANCWAPFQATERISTSQSNSK